MNPQFWRGKRVFLTGHTGFKGAWLSLWLQRLGADVTGFALPPATTPSLFEAARVADGVHSVFGDIRDPEALFRVLDEARPEIVLHLAAQALVQDSYRRPVETYSTNVMGLVNLLEGIRRVPGIKAVVNVTTDKCYDNREWIWGYRENDPLGGYDPYSSSKACAELVTSAYRSSFFNPRDYPLHGLALATARAGNVIGGGDWAADRLVPDLVRAIGASQPVCVRSPHAVRPWQHVLEPLRGYLMLAERLYSEGAVFAEAWNFGPETRDAKPVQWLVDRLTSLWGNDAGWVTDDRSHPHEATYLGLDCAKAGKRLGWYPKWPVDETIRHIVSWHKAHLAGGDMRAVTLGQIEEYMQRL